MKPSFKRNRKKFFLMPFGIAALLALVSYVVMLLWNSLLPEILHTGTITFWQAMGLFILCKILFGFGKGNSAPWMRHRMHDRCNEMSQEDRELFKERMKKKFCGWNKPETDNI